MKQLLKFAKPYRKSIILAICFVMLDVFVELATPQFVKLIINRGIGAGNINYTIKVGIMMIAFAALGIVAGFFNSLYSARSGVGYASDIRDALFKKVQGFSFNNIDSFSTASLSTRLTNDITQIQNTSVMGLRIIAKAPLMLPFSVIMAIRTSKDLSLIIAVIIPILALGLFFIMRRAVALFTNMQVKVDNLNRNIQENVTNVRVVKSFVREDFEKDKFKKSNQSLMDASIAAMNRVILNMPLMMGVMNAAIVGVVWFGGSKVINGTSDVASISALINYIFHILMSLMMLSLMFVMMTRASASFKRVAEVINTEVDVVDQKDAKNTAIIDGSVKFDNVSFKYKADNEKNVLSNISFEANAGQIVAILGSTGSGKTTLVSLIPRLYDVTEGHISFGDYDIKDLTLENLRDQVAMVLQKNTLFSGTIKDNLKWGNKNATDEELIEACKNAQAHDFIMSFPEQYDTWVEQGGVNLSGGQKQRLCIARALLKNPKILILDDSTSAVDTATEAKIREAFRKDLKDTTVFLIAQRISSVIDADSIIVMDDGRIVAMGNHEQLMENSEEYREIYYSQIDKAVNK